MSTALKIQAMIRNREPGAFFGGGILAGILVFLVWFAMLPSQHKPAAGAPAGANAAQTQHPLGANGEILSSITGGPELGQAGYASVTPDEQGSADAADSGLQDGDIPGQLDAPFTDDPSDGAVAGDEVPLEAHAEIDGAPVAEPAAQLQVWYVEVLRDGNGPEVLQVNAESPEHALEIIRDYRGNPRVLRGPSVQPLE